MNDDRCMHVPTSAGQSVCSCLDARMTLRLVIEVLRGEEHPRGAVTYGLTV